MIQILIRIFGQVGFSIIIVDKQIPNSQLDLNGMRSPPVSKNIYRISSASAKSINDTSPSILALELPTHALIQLKKWIESPTSNTIWIEGTLPFSYRSRNNLPRWKYYQNTTSPPPRCIFASCDLRHIFRTELRPHESESNEEFALLSLLDSIIAQLQGIFPSLSFSKPELLDRSTKSIDVALKMIWTFLEQDKVPSLIWIIDGLQFTESESTNPSVIELVYNLRVRGYKVCFTTQGASEVLSEVTSEYERVNALIAIGRNEGSR